MRRFHVASLALLAVAALPGVALAHEHLRKSEPSADARVTTPPARLRFWFSEAPDIRLTSIMLRDSTGYQVRLGPVERDTGDAMLVSAHVLEHLGPGRYVVAWIAAGADGHPARGTFSFTVLPTNIDAAVPTPTTPGQHAASVDGAVAQQTSLAPVFVLARAMTFIALLLIIGAVVFRTVILPRSHIADVKQVSTRVAMVGVVAATALIASDGLRLALQQRLLSGMLEGNAMPMRDLAIATGWGRAWAIQVGAAILAVIGFSLARRRAIGWTLAMVAALGLSISSALAGHAAAVGNAKGAAIAADSLHVLGAAGWLGSLSVLLIGALPIVAMRDEARRWPDVAALVGAFSPVALLSAALVGLTGLITAWIQLRSIPALWTTAYGRTLLVKLALLAGVVATGAYNWLRVRPLLGTETATRRLQRSAAIELLVGALVVGVTSVLVATETPGR